MLCYVELSHMSDFVRTVWKSDRHKIIYYHPLDRMDNILMNISSSDSLTEIRYMCPLNTTSPSSFYSNVLMSAWVLPIDQSWPFFYATKQGNAILRNVVFDRSINPQSRLVGKVVRHLEAQRNILVIGTPDIGKTAMSNVILLELLGLMRANRTPITTIYVRVPVVTFRLTRTTKRSKEDSPTYIFLPECNLEIEMYETVTHHVALESWQRYNGITAVLADISESVNGPFRDLDPHFAPGVAGYLSMSTRAIDIDTEAKSLRKEGISTAMNDPHTPAEIEAISRITYHLIKDNPYDMGIVLGDSYRPDIIINEEAFVKVIMDRAKQVGRFMRYLFSDKSYQDRLSLVQTTKPDVIWDNMKLVDHIQLPQTAGYFVGSYLIDKADTPMMNSDATNPIWEIKAHSDELAIKLASLAKNQQHIEVLEAAMYSVLKYQLQGVAMIRNGVLASY